MSFSSRCNGKRAAVHPPALPPIVERPVFPYTLRHAIYSQLQGI